MTLLKRMEPSIELWGTPHAIISGSDRDFPTFITWEWIVRYDWSRFVDELDNCFLVSMYSTVDHCGHKKFKNLPKKILAKIVWPNDQINFPDSWKLSDFTTVIMVWLNLPAKIWTEFFSHVKTVGPVGQYQITHYPKACWAPTLFFWWSLAMTLFTSWSHGWLPARKLFTILQVSVCHASNGHKSNTGWHAL